MSDQALRDRILDAALAHAGFDGFTDKVLAEAAREAGADDAECARLFPDGAASLVEAFSGRADRAMTEALSGLDLKDMRLRDRIRAAVRARILALAPHREAARRAGAFLAMPANAALGLALVYRTVDAMWRAAGDTSTDFNFYTKRAILAGVYGSTLLTWFSDESEDRRATWDFLDRRIDDVMRFEKFKADVRKSLHGLPTPFEVVAGLRRRN